jgi:hypothetical protein
MNMMSFQAGRRRALHRPKLHVNTWPISTEAISRPWILLKYDHYQSPRSHVKLDRTALSEGPNLHANTWPHPLPFSHRTCFDFFSKLFQGGTKGLNAVPPHPHTPDGPKTGSYFFCFDYLPPFLHQGGWANSFFVLDGLTYTPTRDPRLYRSCILYQSQRSYYYVFGYY